MSELVAVVRAAGAVSWMALKLRWLGFAPVCAQMLETQGAGRPAGDGSQFLNGHLRALDRTARLPWSTCLTRSAVAVQTLRKQRIDATLVIGTQTTPSFAAHAWVAVGNNHYGRGNNAFVPLSAAASRLAS